MTLPTTRKTDYLSTSQALRLPQREYLRQAFEAVGIDGQGSLDRLSSLSALRVYADHAINGRDIAQAIDALSALVGYEELLAVRQCLLSMPEPVIEHLSKVSRVLIEGRYDPYKLSHLQLIVIFCITSQESEGQ